MELYNSGLSTVKIGKMFGKHYSTVRNVLINNGVKLRNNKINSRKYTINENYFKNIDTEEKAYWLGFIYADGYISNVGSKKIGIAIKSSDIKHLEKFNKSLDSTYPIKVYKNDTTYGNNIEYCRLIITSDTMFNDLLNQGVFEHKSLILQPPLSIPTHLLRHFVRGYLDGDGTISKNGNSYYVGFIGTKEFLEWLHTYIESNEIVLKIRLEQRHENCEALSFKIHGKNAYKLLKLLYDDSTIYLNRKYERYKEAINYFSRLYQ